MKTAVQLRGPEGRDLLKSDLLCGTPSSVVMGKLGPVAIFDSDHIVGYRIQHGRRTRVFVFRTLVVDDRLAASVPGVKPRVELLLDVHSAGRARLVRGLFAYLAKRGQNASDLADALYVRVGVALAGRLPPHKILSSLLHSAER